MFKRLTSLALAGALSLGLVTAAPASQGSGCLPTTGTVSGLSFAQLINSAIAALISSNSGASAPATDCTAVSIKGQTWLDTSITPNVLKKYDGTQWVAIGAIDSANHVWSPPVGGGANSITAASTTNICGSPSAVQIVTGSTPITSLGSDCAVGVRKTLIFSGATPLTYNATSLIIPGLGSYTTTAGDAAEAIYLGAGNWRLLAINKADGTSVTNPAVPVGTILDFGGDAPAPEGFLMADGACESSATYPALSARFGTKYGTCPAGQFRKLDARGRVLSGTDNLGLSDAGRLSGVPALSGNSFTIGATYGAGLKTLANSDLPVTNLSFAGTVDPVSVTSTSNKIAYGDIISANNGSTATDIRAIAANGNQGTNSVSSTGSFTPRGTISSFGGGGSFALLQPTILVNKIIKY